jgi:tetratricopeptide (TPR) repeat protein
MINKFGFSYILFSISAVMLVVGCSTAPKQQADNSEVVSRTHIENMSVVGVFDSEANKSSCSQVKEKIAWKEHVARMNSCAAKKDWASLESLAAQFAKFEVNSPWGPYFLSVAAESRNDWPRAMWMVETAIKRSGKNPPALFVYHRGRIWAGMGEMSKGMAEIKQAVAIEPKLIDGQMYLAQIYERDADATKALGYYRAVLKVAPEHWNALAGVAMLRAGNGGEVEAAEIYPRLKSALDNGQIREKAQPELAAKIKALGLLVKNVVVPDSRVPAPTTSSTAVVPAGAPTVVPPASNNKGGSK